VEPGEFRYWIVHLKYVENDGVNVKYAEHSPEPYQSAEDAWAAGVQECRRIIEKVETDADRKFNEGLDKVLEMAWKNAEEVVEK
jgi:hypothetical protein